MRESRASSSTEVSFLEFDSPEALPSRGWKDAWDAKEWFDGGSGKSRWDWDAPGQQNLQIKRGGWGGRGKEGKVRVLFLVGESDISC